MNKIIKTSKCVGGDEITRCKYEHGKCVEEITTDYHTGNKYEKITRHKYDEAGNNISSTIMINGDLDAEIYRQFDENNNVISECTYKHGIFDSKTVYVYNDKILSMVKDYVWDNDVKKFILTLIRYGQHIDGNIETRFVSCYPFGGNNVIYEDEEHFHTDTIKIDNWFKMQIERFDEFGRMFAVYIIDRETFKQNCIRRCWYNENNDLMHHTDESHGKLKSLYVHEYTYEDE